MKTGRESLPLVTVAEFASTLKSSSGQIPRVRCEMMSVAKSATDGELEFVASTPATDRMGDVVLQDGWVLDAFRRNPVLLWAHDYETPPVGRVGEILVDGGALKAKRVEFQSRDIYEFGWAVGEMYRRGFLSAVSVGFSPLEWRTDEATGGTRFLRQELLELSAVPVPANPEALVAARSAGLLVRGISDWAERALDTLPDSAPARKYAHAIWRALTPAQAAVPADWAASLTRAVEANTAALIELTRQLAVRQRVDASAVEASVRRHLEAKKR